MLRFPPIRYNKPTELMTYKYKLKRSENIWYKMFDTKSGKIVGEMKARPEVIDNKYQLFSTSLEVYRSFFIDRMFAFERGRGVGRAFVNIAKRESHRYSCTGNVHVISSSIFDKENPPHIFYRKMGFNLNKYSSLIANYLDECIKTKSQVASGKCPRDIPMFIAECTKNQQERINELFKFRIKFPDIYNRF